MLNSPSCLFRLALKLHTGREESRARNPLRLSRSDFEAVPVNSSFEIIEERDDGVPLLSSFLFPSLPLSRFLFIARRTALTRGKFSRDGGEDYPSDIKRYRGHKGVRPILDIKPPGLTFRPRVSRRELSD